MTPPSMILDRAARDAGQLRELPLAEVRGTTSHPNQVGRLLPLSVHQATVPQPAVSLSVQGPPLCGRAASPARCGVMPGDSDAAEGCSPFRLCRPAATVCGRATGVVDGPHRGASSQDCASRTSASKQVRSPVWQAAPTWSTTTSSASPSQSRRTSRTCCTLPGGVALAPVLAAAAAPVGRAAGRQGPVQRLVVHPADHQHLAAAVLLHDGGHQALAVALEARREGGVQWRGRGHPHIVTAGQLRCWAAHEACSWV